MPLYQCRFIDHGGHVRGTEQFDACDDQVAIEQAMEMNLENVGSGFEIWQSNRLVHTYRNRQKDPK